MITSNVLLRVRHLLVGGRVTGTGFTIDIDGRFYLITARHLFDGLIEHPLIQVQHQRTWRTLEYTTVWLSPAPLDIAVLAPAVLLTVRHELTANMGGISIGQTVFFAGFPFGLSTDILDLTEGYPIPLVKKATLSGIAPNPLDPDQAVRAGTLLLDGINNSGFSGGPVVFQAQESSNEPFKIAGVISGYRYNESVVHHQGEATPLSVRENTGIIFASAIAPAVDAIRANPIGRQIAD